jgi:regulation of enolase protein 1 (concanavalin A-like superfamily)
MKMIRAATALACACVLGIAAAQDKPRKIEGWGEVIDPVGDCKIVQRAGQVSITVPGAYRDLYPLPGWNNLDAPRVLQEVEGDFTVQVLARKFERPKAGTTSNKEKPASFVAGGLLIWQDGKNFLRFMRAANGERGDVFTAAVYCADGDVIAGNRFAFPDEDTHLRVERKKGKFTLSHSQDGKKWTTVRPMGKDLTLPAKVNVGVAVVNATTKEIVHEFEELRVTKP